MKRVQHEFWWYLKTVPTWPDKSATAAHFWATTYNLRTKCSKISSTRNKKKHVLGSENSSKSFLFFMNIKCGAGTTQVCVCVFVVSLSGRERWWMKAGAGCSNKEQIIISGHCPLPNSLRRPPPNPPPSTPSQTALFPLTPPPPLQSAAENVNRLLSLAG